jgi:hypothetical protein
MREPTILEAAAVKIDLLPNKRLVAWEFQIPHTMMKLCILLFI